MAITYKSSTYGYNYIQFSAIGTVNAGDLLVMFGQFSTAPSGFTLATTNSGYSVYYRFASGNENQGGTFYAPAVGLLLYSGVTSLDVLGSQATTYDTTYERSPSVTTTSAGDLIVFANIANANSSDDTVQTITSISQGTIRFNAIANNYGFAAADLVQSSSGSTGVGQWNLASSYNGSADFKAASISFTLAFKTAATTAVFSYTPTGGISGGGTASALINRSITASGGIVASGAATVSGVAISSTGGIIASGSSSATSGFSFTPITSSLIASGSSSYSLNFSLTPTGGIAASGTVSIGQAFSITSSSGITANGSQTAIQGFPATPAGGIVASGAASLAASFSVAAVAGTGLKANGTGLNPKASASYVSIGAVQPGSTTGTSKGFVSIGAVQPIIFGATASGGITTSGSGSTVIAFAIASTGGIVASGSATSTFAYAWQATGGIVASGSSSGLQAIQLTASGGLVASGSQTPLQSFSILPSGGIVASGSQVPGVRFNSLPTGGLIASGAASSTFTDLSPYFEVWQGLPDGSPIDYTATPTATLRGLTWTSSALATPSSTRFAVRAYDPLTGYDDGNLDATVIVTLDSFGRDITSLPNAPTALTASPGPSGTLVLRWASITPPGSTNAPSGFYAYLGTGTGSLSYSTPAATVPYVSGLTLYTATLSGLTNGTTYTIGVRAYNAVGSETNTATTTATASTTGPLPISSLTGIAL